MSFGTDESVLFIEVSSIQMCPDMEIPLQNMNTMCIAHVILPPLPPLSPLFSELPHTPKSKVSHVLTVPPPHLTTTTTIHNTSLSPRFNLRPLASYYNLTCIGLSMILLWLLLIPLWVMMVLMCLLVCGGCVCSRKGRRKTL